MPRSGQTGEGPWRTDVRGERAGLQRMSEEVRKETLASIQDLRAEWWLKNCFYLEKRAGKEMSMRGFSKQIEVNSPFLILKASNLK